MSFPPYPKYKDSGVEWLGEVPEHWTTKRLGYFFQERNEKVSDTDFEPLSVTMQGIVPQIETAAKSDAGDNRKRVACGDFVINSRSDRKGSSGVSSLDGSVSLISIVLTPREEVRGDFIHHLLRSVDFQEEYYRYGKGIVADLWSTKYSEMKNINLAVPPLPEQHAIAAFLDRETAKIDALIAEQRRLIELLKEKRQAVISHAVTKGLNPDAPMKDSGIEWLGEVPEHWEIIKFGHLVRESPCYGVLVPDHDDDGVPMLRITDMEKGRAVKDDLNKISPGLSAQYSRTIVAVGDIALSVVGTIGEALIVDEELAGVNLSRAVARIQVNDRIHASYATTVFASSSFRRYIDLVCVGTAQRVLNMSDLVAFRLALPPVDEQSLIQRYVHSATVRLDVLLDQAEQSITLLQERRAALISAAVTGKIDVRGVQGTGDAA